MRSLSKLCGTVAGACLVMLVPVTTAWAQGSMANEKGMMQGPAKYTLISQGTLAGTGGHQAAGTVHVFETDGKRRLHFDGGFKAEKGGQVEVLLSAQAGPDAGAVMVGTLKSFAGEQTFDIPPRADLATLSHVVLFEKRSNLVLGAATLSTGGMGMMGDKMGKMGKMDKMKDTTMAKPR